MPCDRRSILKGTSLGRWKLKSQLDWKYLSLFSGSHFLHCLGNIDKNRTCICFAFVKAHVSVGLIIDVVSSVPSIKHMGADKSLVRPGRKQATATEGFEFHISYL